MELALNENHWMLLRFHAFWPPTINNIVTEGLTRRLKEINGTVMARQRLCEQTAVQLPMLSKRTHPRMEELSEMMFFFLRGAWRGPWNG
jgi:hypothetical protein